MATVSSFEGLTRPNKSELRQFAELFMPLFQASSEEAKRQAVAALSQCEVMPQAVCLFIGSQPISIAAPFLISSPAISDETLIAIARTQGAEHAKTIVNRGSLSPKVIDALVALRHSETRPQQAQVTLSLEDITVDPVQENPAANPVSIPQPAVYEESSMPSLDDGEEDGGNREAEMRSRLKDLAAHMGRRDGDRLGLRTLSALQQALLVRFARVRDAKQFSTTLADALSASRWLIRRIMLDISGRQLAMTLTSLGTPFLDMIFILERLYPHLSEMQHGVSRAWMLLDSLDPEECQERVDAWRKADSYTYDPEKSDATNNSNKIEESSVIHRPYRLVRRSR